MPTDKDEVIEYLQVRLESAEEAIVVFTDHQGRETRVNLGEEQGRCLLKAFLNIGGEILVFKHSLQPWFSVSCLYDLPAEGHN